MKCPFIDDAPQLQRETKIVVRRRPRRTFDKLRGKGDLSGEDGPIGCVYQAHHVISR